MGDQLGEIAMPGKSCDGSTNTHDHREAQAFCEGRYARTQSASPTNPHPSGSVDAAAWDRGVASKVASPNDHGCCAPSGAAAV